MALRPFDKVPPEILSYILTLAWSSYVGDDSTGRFLFPSIPIQVNRKFNSAALSTPTLWSYLRIADIKGLGHIQHRIENRSGALPLDLYLIFNKVTHEEAQEMVERSIAHRPPRFQSIILSYPNKSIIDSPVAKFWDHLRPLFSLHSPLNPTYFSISNRSTSKIPLNFLTHLGPALRCLEMYCNLTWSTVSLPNNLESLSLQELGGVSVVTVLECLGAGLRCSLRSLSLGGVGIRGAEHIPADSYILDGLRRLQLSSLCGYELGTLLNTIGAPNIRHLSLKNIYPSLTGPTMTTWWPLSFQHLQKLSIEGIHISTLHLAGLIKNLPTSVDCLEITAALYREGEAVDALFEPSTTAFCSRLRHIIARGVRLRDLAKLVEERCTSLHALQVAFTRGTFEMHHSPAKGQLSAYFRRLTNSVTVLKVLRDGGDDDIDERTTSAFEEFEQQQRSLVENYGGVSEDRSD